MVIWFWQNARRITIFDYTGVKKDRFNYLFRIYFSEILNFSVLNWTDYLPLLSEEKIDQVDIQKKNILPKYYKKGV